MELVIDDDKHHYGHTVRCKDIPLDENITLQRTRHVRDNARGLTMDVACYTVTSMPIHIRYRRTDENIQHSLESMIEFLFRRGANLSGLVAIAMDRGYWSPSILKLILSTGADINGTWKRGQGCYPWTFGRQESNNEIQDDDKPHNINVAGPACIFQSSAVHNLGKSSNKHFNLTATAYRSGHSSAVVLTMQSEQIESTASKRTIIDCVIGSSVSAKQYIRLSKNCAEIYMMGFKLLAGEDHRNLVDDDSHANTLRRCVKPLTEEQGCQAWFIMRRYACTSSSMDCVLRKKAPFIGIDHSFRAAYEIVFVFARIYSLHR